MSYQSPLIHIPRKETSDVDWAGPIRSVIAHSYGESPDSYTDEINLLQRCRQDAVRGAGSDQTARDLIYKYFGQLELLELRFAEVKVSFGWKDAFTSKLTTQTSLAYEKASVIHLLSSVLSSLASSASRADPEGLKRAYHNTRAAAGMLTYINDNFLHAPSTDLSREVVQLLIGIMLAQATEIFTEKLVEEKKAASLISRTANQVAGMYAILVEEIKEFQGKGIFDRNWVLVLQIKAKLFASLAQYYRSLADKAKHGTALVRMKMADGLAQEAQKSAVGFNAGFQAQSTPTLPHDAASSLVEITKAHAALCAEAKAQAIRDNDLIYHDILPSEASLPQIDKIPPATPITIQEIYGNPDVSKLIGPDIFARLIPLAIHESASVYSEEKAKLVRGEVERVDISEGEVRASLEHLGLPAAVATWRRLAEGVGEDIEPSSFVMGLHVEQLRLDQLDEARTIAERELRDLTSLLDGESRECERMRAKYAPSFTQSPSGPQSAHLRSNITSNLGALSSAASSDAQLVSLWREVQPEINLILSGPESIRQAAINAAYGANKQENQSPPRISLLDLDDSTSGGAGAGLSEDEKNQLRTAVSDAEERLERLSKVRKERDDTLKDLKEKIQNDDVSNLLLLNRRAPNESQLFAAELEKFRPYQGRLSSAIQASTSILTELESITRSVERNRGVRDRQRADKERNRRLSAWESKMERAAQVYEECRAGLGKGLAFYESLNSVIEDLKREVKGFLSMRDGERNRMVSDIETRRRITSSPPPILPSSASTSTHQSTDRSLDAAMSGMSISQSRSSYSSPSPRPSSNSLYPSPPPPKSTTASSAYPPPPPAHQPSAYPPPPVPLTKSTPYFSPPPPSQPQIQNQQSPPAPPTLHDPYNFDSLSSLPSAFSMTPPSQQTTRAAQPSPQSTSTYPAPLQSLHSPPPPPPPQTTSHWPSMPTAPTHTPSFAGYTSPPPQAPSPYSTSTPQSSYPQYTTPAYGAPSQMPHQHQAPYPPPPGQYSSQSPGGYAPPPPPSRPTYQTYQTQSGSGAPTYPSYTTPTNGHAPPPPQQSQYPSYPPPGGYAQHQQPPSSGYPQYR